MYDFKIWIGGDRLANEIALKWMEKHDVKWTEGENIREYTPEEIPGYYIHRGNKLRWGSDQKQYNIHDVAEVSPEVGSCLFDENEFMSLIGGG